MHLSRILKTTLLLAVILPLAACGKKQENKIRQPQPQQTRQEAPKAKKAKEQKAETAQTAAESESEPDDKRILSLDVDTEGATSGAAFTGSATIKAPFKNPFDASDISVELVLSGHSNGVAINVPMHYERGNSDKSTWSFSAILPKAGTYNYSVAVKTKNENFSSAERKFKATKGTGLGIYRPSKKEPSHFYKKGAANIRAIGANFPATLTGDTREKALDELAAAGANTLRIKLSAPNSLIVPTGEFAGKYNQPMLKNLETLLDSMQKRGMNAVVSFADTSDFGANYANSYFAKSGLAPKSADFFKNPDAIEAYNSLVKYVVNRFGANKTIAMWEPFSGIDGLDISALDSYTAWLSTATSAIRDSDTTAKRPILLSAATSSELDYLWGGEACAFLGFDLVGLRDFSQGAWEHSNFFTKRYKKPVGALSATPAANAPEDPTSAYIRNAMWAGFMTGSPIVPFADFTKVAARIPSAEAIAEISAFEKHFKTADANLEALRLPEKIVQTSSSADENTTIIYPAFTETFPDREVSNDLAKLSFDLATSETKANSIPDTWKESAVISVALENVPTDKNELVIEAQSVSDTDFELVVNTEEKEILRTKISADIFDTKRPSKDIGKIRIPLTKGTNEFTIKLEGKNATMKIARLEIPKTGSMRGVSAIKPFAAKDLKSGSIYIWARRAGAESYTVAKYKLYRRTIPKLKSFDYEIQMQDAPQTTFKVSWWDTKNKKMIAEGELTTNDQSVLKLKFPPFQTDIACVISPLQ